MKTNINVEINFRAIAKLSNSAAKKALNKWGEGKNDLSYYVNLILGEGFTSFSNDDVLSGELSVIPEDSGKSVIIAFSGVVVLCDNYMKTVLPHFSNAANVVTGKGVDLTISKNGSILASHLFEFESPVTWSLAGAAAGSTAESSRTTRSISGTLSIAVARLSRIENDDVCAEDPDQVSVVLKMAPHLLDALKKNKTKITAVWDMDSRIVSNVQVIKVKAGLVTTGSIPTVKNIEVDFSCEADDGALDEEIFSEIESGLMPVLDIDDTRFVFFDCDELECHIN